MKRLYTPVEDSEVINRKRRKINITTFEEIKTKTTLLKTQNTDFIYWKDYEKIKNMKDNSVTNSEIDSINELINGLKGINISRNKLLDEMCQAKESNHKLKVTVKSKIKTQVNKNLFVKPPFRKSLDDTKFTKSLIAKELETSISSIRTNKTAMPFEKRNIITFENFANSLNIKNPLKNEKNSNKENVEKPKTLDKFTPKFSNLNCTPNDKKENKPKNVFMPIPNPNFKKKIFKSPVPITITNFNTSLNTRKQ